jgi:cation diffusion facilitator CzcD-associated flavoprotein CzcO
MNASANDPRATKTVDAVVVGAGFGGMYMLHNLRKHGFTAQVFEAGSDVGGTWYWNRYPGARVDIESMQYSYSFSEELDQEWEWSEKYAPQPEIMEYARHVADRFDLRKDIQFNTRVTKAHFDEKAKRWTVETDQGEKISAQFCIMAVGCLSAANKPPFAGMEDFQGPIYHTGEWPHEGVDFTGKRVAVIGTGSSGIQSIPLIAQEAEQLYVFQRTPNYTVPAWNSPVDPEWEAEVKADYPAMRAKARARPTGFYFDFNTTPALQASEAERRKTYEEYWQRGGLPFLGAFGDLLFNKEANDTIAEFAREKIRAVVKDKATADLLCPDNRDVQPAKREAGGYLQNRRRADHTEGRGRQRRGVCGGRHRLRHRVRRYDGFVRQDGYPRPRWPHAKDSVGGGPAHLSGPLHRRFPELLHDHRARQPQRVGPNDPVYRAARRLDRRLHGTHARRGRGVLGADARSPGCLG